MKRRGWRAVSPMEDKETFIVGYFAKRLFASFQIHAAKIVIVLIIITITTFKKCKNASI